MKDAAKKRRLMHWTKPLSIPRHERHYAAKLTLEKAREIRALYADGCRVGALASQFEVHRNTISQLLRGDSWVEVADVLRRVVGP
jgi:DNA invertase Pin-like site-specific DNA recombinase